MSPTFVSVVALPGFSATLAKHAIICPRISSGSSSELTVAQPQIREFCAGPFSFKLSKFFAARKIGGSGFQTFDVAKGQIFSVSSSADIAVLTEKLPKSQVRIKVSVPGEMTQRAYSNALNELQKEYAKVEVRGFRKGKAPKWLTNQNLKPELVSATAIELLIEDGLTRAIETESLPVIGKPHVEGIEELVPNFKSGQPLNFEVVMDVYPTIKLGDHLSISAQAEVVEAEEADIPAFLQEQQYRMSRTVEIPEPRPAQEGDMLIADMSAFAANEDGSRGPELENLRAIDVELYLSPFRIFADFVEAVIGIQVGETREFRIKFPEDYMTQELRGVDVIFNVVARSMKQRILPEMNDEFAQKISSAETLEDLKTLLRVNLKKQAETATKVNIEKALTDELVKLAEGELPETMIEEETEREFLLGLDELRKKGYDDKDLAEMEKPEEKEKFRRTARPGVIQTIMKELAIKEVAKRVKVSVTDEELDFEMKAVRSEYGKMKEFNEERVKQAVADQILRSKVLDVLREKCPVTMVPTGTLKAEDDDLEAVAEDETWLTESGLVYDDSGKPLVAS